MMKEKKQSLKKHQKKPVLKKQGSVFPNIWVNPEELKKMYAPDCTMEEFNIFVALGRASGANPAKREIWIVKYNKSEPASIFLGLNHYVKIGVTHPDYDGHIFDAVYTNDDYKVVNGIPEHSYEGTNRGDLKRAYCVVYKKGIRVPIVVTVKFSDYNTGFSTWKKQPETQITKVAEAQALRKAFPEKYEGVYSAAEAEVIEASMPEEIIEGEAEEIEVEAEAEPEAEVEEGKPGPKAMELFKTLDNYYNAIEKDKRKQAIMEKLEALTVETDKKGNLVPGITSFKMLPEDMADRALKRFQPTQDEMESPFMLS